MPVGYSIYVEQDSFIHHRVDPRTKLIVLGSIFVLLLCFNDPFYLLVLAGFVAIVAVIAKLGLRTLTSPLIAASWFLILSFLIWPLYISDGNTITTVFNNRPITDIGILFALAMGLRVSVMVVAAYIWMMVTSPQMMTLGLLEMGLPYKAGIAMATSIRFIPLINAERATIVEAQRARGLDYESGGCITRIFRSLPIIGPLFLRSIDLAQSLAIAMEARGFAARDGRSSLYSIELQWYDKLIIATCGILVVVSITARILGFGVIVSGHL